MSHHASGRESQQGLCNRVIYCLFRAYAHRRTPGTSVSVISLPCPTQWSPALCTSLDTVLPYLHLERKVLSASRRSSPGAFKAVGPHLEKGPLGERPKESRNQLEMRYKAVAPLLKEGQQWKGTIRASLEECLRKAQFL